MPDSAAFWLLFSIVASVCALSGAPTPLYRVYQQNWGFSEITTTVVFAAYALGILLALITVGSLSDHLGRKPVVLVCVLLQIGVESLFVFADGVPMLLSARLLQGLVTGAVFGALGAAMIDLDRVRGVTANAAAAPLGGASGAMAAGVFVQYLPDPTRLIYIALAVTLSVQAVLVPFMRETCARRPGSLRSLRPQFGLPRSVRRRFLVSAPVLVASWSLFGLYGALGPTIVRELNGQTSPVLGGLTIVAISGIGALTVLTLASRVSPRVLMLFATTALIVGMAGTLVAMQERSLPGFFAASFVAGSGFGAGYQAGTRSVMPLVSTHERAGVLSIILVLCYASMGVPTVVAGFLIAHAVPVLDTASGYAVFLIVLASAALLGAIRPTAAAVDDSLDVDRSA
ncbi:MFS transporter [Aeromicrobium yanjiei]|nr:MFS transporter [Aeromicrobium yanjiei]